VVSRTTPMVTGRSTWVESIKDKSSGRADILDESMMVTLLAIGGVEADGGQRLQIWGPARKALGHNLLDRNVDALVCLFPQPLLGELV
jgi:hypothetical protein